MKTPGYRGIVPLCVVVILLALGAGAFPADSAARSLLIGIAISSFVLGLVFFEMRSGWIRQRRENHGWLHILGVLSVASTVLLVVACTRDSTRAIPLFSGLLSFAGLIAACAVLECVGSFAALATGKRKDSEPEPGAYADKPRRTG